MSTRCVGCFVAQAYTVARTRLNLLGWPVELEIDQMINGHTTLNMDVTYNNETLVYHETDF